MKQQPEFQLEMQGFSGIIRTAQTSASTLAEPNQINLYRRSTVANLNSTTTFLLKPTHKNFRDLEGQTFGRLTVIHFAGRKGTRNQPHWMCRCECSTVRLIMTELLLSGHSKSCGCLRYERVAIKNSTHGMSRTPEYKIWRNMLTRCLNEDDPHYVYYGKRGITVCDSWRTFENFYADMGDRPTPTHSIDRINNDGNYEPSNCRWATKREQANNRRVTKIITFKGQSKSVSDWAREVNLEPSTLMTRLGKYGWTIEKALTTPLQVNQYK